MKMDYKTIAVEIQGETAVFTLNNPPVNQLSKDFSSELTQAFRSAYEDPGVKAIVLTGTAKNFIAGADITQIQGVGNRDDILQRTMEGTRFISGIETGPKPVVAAINGNCLGAGLEIAMACHFRIAVKSASLGQPEVQIGLIPGAGGTQRLPRLIGLRYALEMITTGKPVKAEAAFQRGLVDELANPDELINKAVAVASRFISGNLSIKARMTRNLHHWIPSAAEKKAMMEFTKAMTAAQSKGYIAPLKAGCRKT
jgi:enoyl-CoA hydratase/carnithine racemase